MSVTQETVAYKCSTCNAPIHPNGDNETLLCNFCGSSMPRPLPEAPIAAEVIEPSEPDWVESWREEIRTLEGVMSQRVVSLLLRIFFVLIPGLAIAISGSISFGVNGYPLFAILSGVIGTALALFGIISVVIAGIAINQVKKQIEAKQKRLAEHAP